MGGKKRVMVPANEVDLAAVKYEPEPIQAPHLTGLSLKFFVKILESPLIGSLIASYLKKQNHMVEKLRNTVIPETPMFKPEFPPQDPEPGVVGLEEDGKPEDRVELALQCLPRHDASTCWTGDSTPSFRYWKIRDYAYAYRSRLATPSMVAERFISAMEEFSNKKPPTPLLISFDAEEVRKQAAASTQRFEEGHPLSILDGIFMAIKDDIDCYPHPSKGATTWFHEVRPIKKDAVSVSRLRSCGVIFVGKANMHEMGLGTTGNNANYGTTRNPHDPKRYTGGSSSGPAAIVASGLCSAALGTDGGGSVRIPSSLCGVVGLKTTYGRTDMKGMTAPVIPPKALESGESNLEVSGNLMRFVLAANLLGLPAISAPVGYDKQGLPIGLQLIGRPWAEVSILRLAAAAEELCSESKKRPQSFYDILPGTKETNEGFTSCLPCTWFTCFGILSLLMATAVPFISCLNITFCCSLKICI